MAATNDARSRAIADRVTFVDPSAVIDPDAVIGDGCYIGVGSFVDAGVRLGDGVRLDGHALLYGKLDVGDACRVWPRAILGEEPQVRGFVPVESGVTIGPRCQIRELVTIHRAAAQDAVTRVGADVMLMVGSHVGHDCVVGDRATICNHVLLAGHAQIGPDVTLSGHVVVHQFARIGRLAMIGGGSRVARDVPPYAMVVGDSIVRGINWVGLRRAGVSHDAQHEIQAFYRILFESDLPFVEAVDRMRSLAASSEGKELVAFLDQPSKRGYCPYRAGEVDVDELT